MLLVWVLALEAGIGFQSRPNLGPFTLRSNSEDEVTYDPRQFGLQYV